MKLLTSLAAFTACFAGANAAYRGLNIASNNEDGSCKTPQQWEQAFNKMHSLPNSLKRVRLYASSDCNQLANAVPAAIKTGTTILATVWAQDQAHYEAEKAALKAAIDQHGSKWILAVAVGSEDLYRKDNPPARLAGQIREVRKLIRGLKVDAPVTHGDTWTAWVDPVNNDVIKACDVIGTHAFPYFQQAAIGAGKDVFFKALDDTRKAVHALNPKKRVWVTETGWPVSGPVNGTAQPSKENAHTYWKAVACSLFQQNVPTFWYSYQDYKSETSFGLIGPNNKPVFPLKC